MVKCKKVETDLVAEQTNNAYFITLLRWRDYLLEKLATTDQPRGQGQEFYLQSTQSNFPRKSLGHGGG